MKMVINFDTIAAFLPQLTHPRKSRVMPLSRSYPASLTIFVGLLLASPRAAAEEPGANASPRDAVPVEAPTGENDTSEAAEAASPRSPSQARASREDREELEHKVDALAEDLTDLKERIAIPETDALKSQFGLGPAASKVYGVDRGLSIGGYGEFYLGHYLGDPDNPLDRDAERPQHRGDIYRFILYTGYKFNDWIVMNTEVELEHSTTGTNPENGESGSVSVEFLYLDLLFSKYASVRAGLMLVPMGIINEMHEPTTYNGNFRPETERRIIPSTWREPGVGLFGSIPGGFEYNLYFVSGLSDEGFDEKGVRGGRQKGNHFAWEDKAGVASLKWHFRDHVTLGSSFYYGGADQDPHRDDTVRVWIVEGHTIFRYAGAELRGLLAINDIDGAAKNDIRTPEQQDPASDDYVPEPIPKVVPTRQIGWYAEGSYDVFAQVERVTHVLAPFVRYEALDLNDRMYADQAKKGSLDTAEITAGLGYKPHPQVVIKAEFAHRTSDGTHDNEDGDTVSDPPRQEIRLGAGFIF
jgi:hypothetical protein